MRSAVATRILKNRDKSMGLILKEKIVKYYNKLIGMNFKTNKPLENEED